MTRHEVENVLDVYRPLLEAKIDRFLVTAREGPKTAGFCCGSSAALIKLLEVRFPEASFTMTGGYGADTAPCEGSEEYLDHSRYPGGMIDTDGNWRGHFWIESVFADGTAFIVDATADQFGHPVAVVADIDDRRYRKNLLPDVGYGDIVTDAEDNWGEQLFQEWSYRHMPETAPVWLGNISFSPTAR